MMTILKDQMYIYPYQSLPPPLQTLSVECATFLAVKQALHLEQSLVVWFYITSSVALPSQTTFFLLCGKKFQTFLMWLITFMTICYGCAIFKSYLILEWL